MSILDFVDQLGTFGLGGGLFYLSPPFTNSAPFVYPNALWCAFFCLGVVDNKYTYLQTDFN